MEREGERKLHSKYRKKIYIIQSVSISRLNLKKKKREGERDREGGREKKRENKGERRKREREGEREEGGHITNYKAL